MIKVKHFTIGIGLLLILSACSGEKTVKENNESKIEAEILTLETLLKEKKYEDLLIKMETIDLSESETDKVRAVGTKFVDQLIQEKNFEFLDSKYNRMRINLNRDDWTKVVKFVEQEKEIRLDEMEQAVRNNDFQKVQELYDRTKGLEDNADFSAMYNYAQYLQTDQNSYEASGALALAVDPEYHGRMREEIVAGITNTSYASPLTFGPISLDDWNWIEREYRNNLFNMERISNAEKERKEKIESARGSNPSLGMTYEEVLASLWGEPYDVNRTVTEYGTYEQWMYGNGQYLYFEDGILTSFQD
ncbi:MULTISPECIES: hypothetical protein [Lysinibacillus]|uniref:hypothetical protein n=1 Tax=Lysinibacillus TaxID=400634 RepID=UPI0004D51D20|nr:MULTISPECIES: hypothetical protein [Lysinibacillus]AJK86579.1 hypothetical protein HR49_04910 [Lysinibacillus fusiformis]KHK51477.1 hypothetical protein PI85_13995 [Lysinibacillus sp. A1]